MSMNSDMPELWLLQQQQQDPDIEAIVMHTKFVVAYLLQQDGTNPGWRKANTEGPLYLVRRRSAPRYELLVKNQLSSNDLVDHLHPEWELDCQKNYVFYKVEDPNNRIRGLWFDDDTEREKLEVALERTLAELRAGETEAGAAQVAQESDSVTDNAVNFGPTKPQGESTASSGRELQSSGVAGDRLTVSRETLRAALHALAEDDSFVGAVMQKLKDNRCSGRS